MWRIFLGVAAVGLGISLHLATTSYAQDGEQGAENAKVSGRVMPTDLAGPVPAGSKVRITSAQMQTCAEVDVGGDLTFNASLPARDGCSLSPGDSLGFWLIRPDGSIELLSPVGGEQPVWAPGADLRVDLGAVPCPEPCLPPEVAGPPDAELLPTTGSGESQDWGLAWKVPLIAALSYRPSSRLCTSRVAGCRHSGRV